MAGARGRASFTMDLSALERVVAGGLEAMRNRQQLMEAIGEAMVSSTQQRFEEGKAPDGTPWEVSGRAWQQGLGHSARKATKTRKARRRKKDSGRFGKTLVDTARLRNSLDYEASPGMVVCGTNVEYAAIHQFGGQAGRNESVTLPARPYLGINAEDEEEIRGTMLDYLIQSFGG